MKAFDKLKNLNPFKKPEQEQETKETAKGPWVKVIEVHFDKDNPQRGYFELDWNEDFVGLLGEAGYAGPTDEAIVDLWFNDLCRSIVLEQEIEGNNVPGTPNQ
jgi:hypothetical protein|tara:strand:+ start:138 stop:446 length:309 start_codon:yes stop_codon:yes gene_type:complete